MLHAILLLQLAAPPAQPLYVAEAERLVHASIRDYELGFFEQALHEAEEAYRLDPLAQILFNIGQCHRALKHWEKAMFYYQRYLERLPEATNRQAVQNLLAEANYRHKAELLGPAPSPSTAATGVVAPTPTTGETPAPQVETVPIAAVAAEPKRHHPHTAAWVLGSVAVACVAVAVVGIVEVESFEALQGRLASPVSYTQWLKDDTTAKMQGSSASTWETVAFVSGAVALGTGTAAVFTW